MWEKYKKMYMAAVKSIMGKVVGDKDREGSHPSDLRYPTPCHHLPPLLSLCHQHLTLDNFPTWALCPLPLTASFPHKPNDLYKYKSDQVTLTPRLKTLYIYITEWNPNSVPWPARLCMFYPYSPLDLAPCSLHSTHMPPWWVQSVPASSTYTYCVRHLELLSPRTLPGFCCHAGVCTNITPWSSLLGHNI